MKLQSPFLQLPISFDAQALAEEVGRIPDSAWRPHPNGLPGNDALTLITTHGDPESDDLSGAMLPTPHLLACPYLMQTLEAIGATWGRSRLMRLSGMAEVTPHVDINYYWRERMRVHVPIVTQPTVRFQVADAEINMAEGECWIFDTWSRHCVINDASRARIHLVADTVGGEGIWPLIRGARPAGAEMAGWKAPLVRPDGDRRPELDYEMVNAPAVMSPWEMRAHIGFLAAEAQPHPALGPVRETLMRFTFLWQGLWARYGDAGEGLDRYRRLLDQTRAELGRQGVERIVLRNEMSFLGSLDNLVLLVALNDGAFAGSPERIAPQAAPALPSAPDPEFERPVFIVSSPRSGSTMLFESLAQAPGVFTIGDESHGLIEGVEAFSPPARGWESNRLDGSDAAPAAVAELRRRFRAELRDRDARRPPAGPARMLEKTPKNALRIPLLAAAFPEAHFIYLFREPREVLASMMEAWASGHFRTYSNLPGWPGPPWSLLLTPGWRELKGRPLAEIVADQWAKTTAILLDDLEALGADRWTAVDYGRLTADPKGELARLLDAVSLGADERVLKVDLPLSRYTVSPPDPDKWRRHEAELAPLLERLEPLAQRARRAAS